MSYYITIVFIHPVFLLTINLFGEEWNSSPVLTVYSYSKA